MFLLINAVNTASKSFQVLGDVTATLGADDYIQVLKSTGNNGIYKLVSAVYATGYTTLTTVEAIPSAIADGSIAGGVYELQFADAALAGKASLIVAPWATNTTTSLKFNGKAALNFGEYQQQNMLRVLENFAASVAPTNPTIGQHWYDAANSVVKVYTATGWSSDLNVEGGVLSFKDPQHPTANTKYFITAAEPVGKTGSGVTLYPAANPTAGQAMFRIVDATGVVYFEVDYAGKLVSFNPLNITATSDSTFLNSVSLNTGGAAATGLNVKNNIVVTTGDITLDASRALKSGTSSITMNPAIAIRGTTTTGGVLIQGSTGSNLTQFADALVTFFVPVTATTLGVTGTATIATAAVTTLGVSGVSTLATTNVTTLNVSGVSSLTTLGVTGVSTLATVNATTLNVTGITGLNVVSITDTLQTTGVATFNNRVDIAHVPTVGNDATNKTYVDATITSRSTENRAIFTDMVDIAADANLDYTLAGLAGGDAALYDPIATQIEVLVLDEDALSATDGYYINSEGVATVGIKADGNFRIHNHFSTIRSFYVSITLLKL